MGDANPLWFLDALGFFAPGRVLRFNLKERHEKRLLGSCIQIDFG
jgi:hypothetical protein